jgi:hypothetical protein
MKPVQYVTIVLVPGEGRYCSQCRQRLTGERGLVVAKDVLDPSSGHILVPAGRPQREVFDALAYEGWRFSVMFLPLDGTTSVVFERPNPREKS